jgi:hypothetical protein
VLQRIGRPGFNPLETLVANEAVPPGDVLPAGLKILGAANRTEAVTRARQLGLLS